MKPSLPSTLYISVAENNAAMHGKDIIHMTQKILLVIFFAGVAFGASIPVTGSGTFSLDNDFSSSATVFFSGSGDAGSVYLFARNVPEGLTAPTIISGTTTLHPEVVGIATIDGVQNNNYWAFSVGAGPGYLDLLDATGHVLMHQDITGYIQITSYQEFGSRFNSDGNPNRNWGANGTFSITPIPTPEPGSGLLVGWGIFAALLFGRRKYAGSARSRCAQSVV